MSLRDYLFHEEPGITLYCGDCRDVLPLLEADAVISDPPYGIAYVKGPSGSKGAYRGSTRSAAASRGTAIIAGDAVPFDPTCMLRFSNVLLWGANHYCHLLPPGGRWLAWDKLEGLASFDSFSDVEFAWHSRGKASRLFSFMWKGGLACRKAGENNGRRDHPTQKPEALMRWCITQSGVGVGETVLDPFAGSGTTLVAAKDTGRRAIGIEIEPRYCEIAVKRLRQEVLAL